MDRAAEKLFGRDPSSVPLMTAAELEAIAGPKKKRDERKPKKAKDSQLELDMNDEVTLEEMTRFAPDLFEPDGLFDAVLPTGVTETLEQREARFSERREETKALVEEARREDARRRAARCAGCGGKRMLSECKAPDRAGFWHGACLKLARARAELVRLGREAEAKTLKLVDHETALMFSALKEAWDERQALPQRKRGKPFVRDPKTRKRIYKKGTFLPTMEVPPSEGFFFGRREGDEIDRIDSVFALRTVPVYQAKAWEERKEERFRQKAAAEGREAGRAFRRAERALEKAARKARYEKQLAEWAAAKAARVAERRQHRQEMKRAAAKVRPKPKEREKILDRIAETPIAWRRTAG